MIKNISNWLDERSGYRAIASHALDEPVRGGASYAYVFGSVLTFIFVLQALTGIFLAMYYSPSTTDAWASVAFIEDQVTLGWFVRGLHSHGASAMVIISGIHMLQTALYGAYKKPRELGWLIGVVMLALVLSFALTGYLLPWDQTGYWATKVATGIAGSSPVIGQSLQEGIQGGNEYGNLTLTRFFAIHVFLLPLALGGLTFLHIALFRKHSQTPPWWKSEKQLDEDTEPFWPHQLFKDMVAIVLVLGALVAFILIEGGVGLDAPADPSSGFEARPEWYFRPLFQLLKYFSGPMETVVALGLPVVIGGFLCALPFVDRGKSRSPKRRMLWLGMLLIGFAGAGVLTLISFRDDANNPLVQEEIEQAEISANKARALAKEYGVPAEGGLSVFTMEPGYAGKKIWAADCAPCHEGDDRKAPRLGPGYNSRTWIKAFLLDPSGDEFFGQTSITKMKPVQLEDEELNAVVEWLYSQSQRGDADVALVTKGKALIEEGDCTNCHSTDWESEGELGPNLGRRGSLDMLKSFISDPDHPRWFGESNEMPKQGPYSDKELSELAQLIFSWQSMAATTR